MDNGTDKQTKQLFNSFTEPVPPVRRDVDLIPVEHKGQSYVVAHDSLGYVPEGFALPAQAVNLLNVFDGRITLAQLMEQLEQQDMGDQITQEQLQQFVRQLDEHRLLHSGYFKEYTEEVERAFEQSEIRKPASAGISYPEEPDALQNYLVQAFLEHGSEGNAQTDSFDAKALYAPHIDPRVGMSSYVQAFEQIRSLQPQRVVILATSHYHGIYADLYENSPFITTRKTFEMPNGQIPVDQDVLDTMQEQADELGVSFQDRAHRIEHSIELHLLFLRHIWDHDFAIVPLLVDGFDELYYMRDGQKGQYLDRMSAWLGEQFADDEQTFFLISGDLAHIGRKFGDTMPAKQMLDQVRAFDDRFMELAMDNKRDQLFEHMKQDFDPYRICGFPPLLTFLEAFPELGGKRITYDVWDETERESAVTFGSMLFG